MTRRPIAKAGGSFARAGERVGFGSGRARGVKREWLGLTSICPKRVENVWSASSAARRKGVVAIGAVECQS